MSTFEPTNKVLKVQEKAPVSEAMYFDGTDESVLRIAEWVNSYGGTTRYITDGPKIAPVYLSISSDGSWEFESRTTVRPGGWVVFIRGKFERYSQKSIEEEFNLITADTDA